LRNEQQKTGRERKQRDTKQGTSRGGSVEAAFCVSAGVLAEKETQSKIPASPTRVDRRERSGMWGCLRRRREIERGRGFSLFVEITNFKAL
jgi:hypothetical protein